MLKRHLQIRLVKEVDDAEVIEKEFPTEEIERIILEIFVGIGSLILLNAGSKIMINRLS